MSLALAPEETAEYPHKGEVRPNVPNLETGLALLEQTLQGSSIATIRAAYILQAVRDKALYREWGLSSFKDALPLILERTVEIGIKSERMLRYYLALVDVYGDNFELDDEDLVGAASHLFALLSLAEIDRATGELKQTPDKEGKLSAAQFEDVVLLVVALKNTTTPAQQKTGLNAAETRGFLARHHPREVAERLCETYKALLQREVSLPVGGWKLADTTTIVDAVRVKEEKIVVVRQWMVSHRDERYTQLEELQIFVDGELCDVIPQVMKLVDEDTKEARYAPKLVSNEVFDALTKGDKVVNLN